MDVELVGREDRAWTAFLADIKHDVYHLPAYAGVSAELEAPEDEAQPRAVIVREGAQGMLLPLVTRLIPDGGGARDAVSPYGYPGPLFLPSPDPAFVEGAVLAMVELLRSQGVVSAFVRLHPLLNADAGLLRSVGTVVNHGDTVSIDLTRSPEDLWSDTRSGHRNEINRAVRAGHRVFLDETWSHEQSFVDLYAATMERLGASPSLRFGLAYVRALRSALGSRLHLCLVEIGGSIAAAGMFTEECGIVQYHLSGTDDAFARERPTKLMLHFVRGVMKDRGNTVMHLGGGLGAAHDSLYEFKAGFSRQRQPFRTWRVILDPRRYEEFSHWRHPEAEPGDAAGFFPLYRRPVR